MRRFRQRFKPMVYLLLVVFAQAIVLPDLVAAQTPDCGYDRTQPTLESARKNFKITNYACAEQEVNDFLALPSLTLEQRADGHVLLASIYYAQVRNDKEKRTKVTEQFVAAFKAYAAWTGDLDIKSPEFVAMMEEAKTMVSKEKSAEEVAKEKLETPAVTPPPVTKETKGKPWYKKWWAIGLGVGVIAIVAVAAAGGGESKSEPAGALPEFPSTPSR